MIYEVAVDWTGVRASCHLCKREVTRALDETEARHVSRPWHCEARAALHRSVIGELREAGCEHVEAPPPDDDAET